MSPLIWAILILVLGLVLLLLELFIPSAGLLSFLATTALVASVVTVFRYHGMALGAVYLATVFGLLAMLGAFFVRWWPVTPIGRRILNLPRRGSRNDANAGDKTDARNSLVGQLGRAKTKMLPSGAIEIGGRTYDAVSEGVPIEPGQTVKVIETRGNRIVVRPSRDMPPQEPEDTKEGPLDMVVPDPFDDRLS